MKRITPEEFRRNYIEARDEYVRFNMVLEHAYNKKQCYARMAIDLGSIPAYEDIADYLGYKMTLAKRLDELDKEELIRNEVEVIIRPKIGLIDK